MIIPRSNSFIGVHTENFKEAGEFYVRFFGFTINAESDRFLIVQAPNGKRIIGFGPPTSEAGCSSAFAGMGIHLAFLVEDAEAAMKQFEQAGVAIKRGIKVEDWGEKHFVIADPAGIELYISEALNKKG